MVVTLKDVARASGVHTSTVSRAFSASHLVNPETRIRVLAVANELGYRPNRAARALSTRRTGNLGVIVADIANPFFPPLIKAAQDQARARDHHVFIADTDERIDVEEEAVRSMVGQVDGLILVSPRLSDRRIRELADEVPLVVVNRRLRRLPCVLMDVGEGIRLAVGRLADLGHREIATVLGPPASWTGRAAVRAAEETAREHGVRTYRVGPHQPTEEGGAAAFDAVLDLGVTAVLAHNDLMALGLLRAARERGVAVPERLSVVGTDDTLTARHTRPALTTVAMPVDAAGRAAVDLLLRGADPEVVTLGTRPIERDSTGPAPRG
ncbi:LacI family DNA-binding transcriptional regulator [Nocardiopsis lambiniae]|uniref:LacI family DNA-binding transcriptional regulator n=1 Tax=Nocardiopsis lambiniae TaxID=3075539 RepID=A0ABU2M3J3_9ACTN|nr:LacI family DNA-binding transcriptional regulator [Nocardiopsis sp. DSM 44743]MDT0327211.1 LacI family DNA-binding transcriptional regulator [Nocardiopsis sp. DSM 44743]